MFRVIHDPESGNGVDFSFITRKGVRYGITICFGASYKIAELSLEVSPPFDVEKANTKYNPVLKESSYYTNFKFINARVSALWAQASLLMYRDTEEVGIIDENELLELLRQ